MRPYETYKDCGVEWLGEVPEHWSVRQLKYIASLNPSKSEIQSNFSPDTPVTFLPMEKVSEDWNFDATSTASLGDVANGLTYFRDGDIIIAKITPCFENGKGALLSGLVNGIGFGSTEFHTIRPQKVNAEYLSYVTRSDYFMSTGESFMTGSAGQKRVPTSFVNDFFVPLPSAIEQTQIVRFLNYQTALIDIIIAKKQKLIGLLKEKRQSVINEAVTKGLNPHTPMKDSGVEWLGEVPEHWEIIPIRYLNHKVGSGVTPKGGAESYTEEGVVFIRSQNVHFDGLRLDDVAKIEFATHDEMSGTKVQYNDVLLNITGASIGRCCVVRMEDEMNVNQHVCIIRPKTTKIVSEYLNLVLSSGIGQAQVRMELTGGNRDGLTVEAIKAFVIPLPEIHEQEEIVAAVSGLLNQVQLVESKILIQIEKLKEYRQSLISEAVTGKIDVRDWEPPVA